jgi:hypothetical protein
MKVTIDRDDCISCGTCWKEYRVLSRQSPDLYGIFVRENTFIQGLHPIFHSRRNEFPGVFTHLLSGFSQEISQPLPLDDLKGDLMDPGYSDDDREKQVSVLRTCKEELLEYWTTGCPG